MFAHLGAGKENVRSTTRALTRKRDAAKQKEKVDDERDDKIIDPSFEADKHMQLVEQELVDRTKTQMLHDQIKDRFVPSLDKLCEQLGDEFHVDSFDESQKKLIVEYSYVMEIHYQTSKKSQEEEEGTT